MATKEPVTVSGWYENTDGTVSKYQWRNGQLDCDATVASWDEVIKDLAARIAALEKKAV